MNGLDALKQIQQGNRENKGHCDSATLTLNELRDGETALFPVGTDETRIRM